MRRDAMPSVFPCSRVPGQTNRRRAPSAKACLALDRYGRLLSHLSFAYLPNDMSFAQHANRSQFSEPNERIPKKGVQRRVQLLPDSYGPCHVAAFLHFLQNPSWTI
jgi:hypothetical protein